MSSIRILFLGDVVGEPGRKAVIEQLPLLKQSEALDFIIVNGENAAGGKGITPKIAIDLLRADGGRPALREALTGLADLLAGIGRHREAFELTREALATARPTASPPAAEGASIGRPHAPVSTII